MLSVYATKRTPEYITFTLNQTEKMFFKSNKSCYELKKTRFLFV